MFQIENKSNDIGFKILDLYLSLLGTDQAKVIEPLLNLDEDSNEDNIVIIVPDSIINDINQEVMKNSVMAPECKTRTTTSDRIVQPNLIMTDARRAHPAQVRWPGENVGPHQVVEDQYTQVVIPLAQIKYLHGKLSEISHKIDVDFTDDFIKAVALFISNKIDADMVDPNNTNDDSVAIKSILNNDQTFGHPSLGMSTVSGCLEMWATDISHLDANAFKQALFHLPRGYRQRAKWYMNSRVAKALLTAKDPEGNDLIQEGDMESMKGSDTPNSLFNKPILLWFRRNDLDRFSIYMSFSLLIYLPNISSFNITIMTLGICISNSVSLIFLISTSLLLIPAM